MKFKQVCKNCFSKYHCTNNIKHQCKIFINEYLIGEHQAQIYKKPFPLFVKIYVSKKFHCPFCDEELSRTLVCEICKKDWSYYCNYYESLTKPKEYKIGI
jgi:hypothetical protein